MAETDIHTDVEVAPAISDPVNALLVASFCITTLLFVMTEHSARLPPPSRRTSRRWCFVRRT